MSYRIIQTNRTERRVTRFNESTGATSEEIVVREPGHVIAEHNDPYAVRKHLEKLARCHGDVQVRVEPDLPPEMPSMAEICAGCGGDSRPCLSSCLDGSPDQFVPPSCQPGGALADHPAVVERVAMGAAR